MSGIESTQLYTRGYISGELSAGEAASRLNGIGGSFAHFRAGEVLLSRASLTCDPHEADDRISSAGAAYRQALRCNDAEAIAYWPQAIVRLGELTIHRGLHAEGVMPQMEEVRAAYDSLLDGGRLSVKGLSRCYREPNKPELFHQLRVATAWQASLALLQRYTLQQNTGTAWLPLRSLLHEHMDQNGGRTGRYIWDIDVIAPQEGELPRLAHRLQVRLSDIRGVDRSAGPIVYISPDLAQEQGEKAIVQRIISDCTRESKRPNANRFLADSLNNRTALLLQAMFE